MEGRMDERTDGQTLFYRTLPATTRGPKIKEKEALQGNILEIFLLLLKLHFEWKI